MVRLVKKCIKILLIFTVFLIYIPFIQAQCTYTLQPGPEDGYDATLLHIDCASRPDACDTVNFGNHMRLDVYAWTHLGADKDTRSLVKFDIGNIISNGCNATKAILTLSHSGQSDDHCGVNTGWHPCKSNDFDIRRITEPWYEQRATWNNEPSFSTSSNSDAYIHIGDSSINTYHQYEIDVTDMVNFWIANPDSNFGIRANITQEFDHYRALYFGSSDNPTPENRPMLKITLDCSNSSYCTNIISGNIYDDMDQTCTRTPSDVGLEDWMVKIEPGPIYATTDQFGNYSANVDQGIFTVTPILKNEFTWNSSCTPSYTVNFTSTDTSVTGIDFPLQASNYCADLWVDIGVARMRKCHNEWFTVQYCNHGNILQDSTYIDVTLDDFIIPQFASIPYTYNSDSSLRFYIGTVLPYECDFFQISTIIDCDVDFGITQCARADIYPRNYCETIDSTWDKSSVQINGQCNGDSSVCFTIFNTGDDGDGDMDGTSEWRLYEDGNLIQTGYFQLTGQETLELCFPANSHTLTLQADQRPGHPGNSYPNEIIESCGNDSTVNIVSATSFTEDDADKHTEIVCEIIRASYDPNEKVEKPLGLSEEKYVDPNIQMEYTLHFQNTGNDTAWLVVLRDTLPQELEVSSIISGVSSHPYSFRVIEKGIVEWRFENIVLPDSATNEDESMGYVKFKIDQTADLAHGTLIENRAGIYFDFNAPVITDYAWNIVWDSTITTTNAITSPWNEDLGVIVYPNPAREQIYFNFVETTSYSIAIYNTVGRNVAILCTTDQYNSIDIQHLASGMYIYSIRNDAGDVISGKFIKE